MSNRFPDLFEEALELEETVVQPAFDEAEITEEMTAETSDISADPTFFDEQVINVPIIDPPDMKSISSYPDTQIYDHLFSTDDDFLLDADAVEDVISSIKENSGISETTAPVEEMEEVVPVVPVLEPVLEPASEPSEPGPVVETEPEKTISAKKPAKKPPVKRAGMPKEEKVETPEPIEEEKPVRRKPRVRRAGETAATAAAATVAAATAKTAAAKPAVTPAAESDDVPPISLMDVNAPRKVMPKKPAGKPDLPQRKTAGKPGAPQKKAPGARPSGRPSERPAAKTPSAQPQRSRAAAQTPETKTIPEEKMEPKKRPFSPLEKMKKRLARKWS